jgi:hypothetical protein
LPAEYGYQATSDALVNIRAGLARATKLGIVDERMRAQLVELARARFYRDRSWSQLLDDARRQGLAVEDLARWPKPDRKAADARMLLRALRADRGRPPAKLAVPRTWALRQLERLL